MPIPSCIPLYPHFLCQRIVDHSFCSIDSYCLFLLAGLSACCVVVLTSTCHVAKLRYIFRQLDYEALMSLQEPAISLQNLREQRIAGIHRMMQFKTSVEDAMTLSPFQTECCAAGTIQSAWRRHLKGVTKAMNAASWLSRTVSQPSGPDATRSQPSPSPRSGSPKQGDEAAGVQAYVRWSLCLAFYGGVWTLAACGSCGSSNCK